MLFGVEFEPDLADFSTTATLRILAERADNEKDCGAN
jgi:hypothetical protein